MNSDVIEQAEPLIGLASLMRMAVEGVELGPLGSHLVARAGADQRYADANALMDLSIVLQLRGDRELAMEIQAQALAIRQIYTPPVAVGLTRRSHKPISLLAIMGPGDLMANSPIEFLLEHADVDLHIVYVTNERDLPEILPRHDLLFVAIAESEANIPLLEKMALTLANWPHPVLNDPLRIARLSRDNNCALLKSVAGVDMPTTARVSWQGLALIGNGALNMMTVLDDGNFPIIVRPVDSHAGKGLEKLDDAVQISDYLSSSMHSEFYVSRFVDYRSADGLFRKYRIVLIAGRPYICHMGISEHWMIHYLNAGMAESAWKRDEEARFMADFDSDFALRHEAAFRSINERVGLDYLGIDCAETRDGTLLIFEVDSCMIVHALDPIDVFPYKQPQMHKLFDAFYQLLVNAVQSGAR